jgi:hypothetical protein
MYHLQVYLTYSLTEYPGSITLHLRGGCVLFPPLQRSSPLECDRPKPVQEGRGVRGEMAEATERLYRWRSYWKASFLNSIFDEHCQGVEIDVLRPTMYSKIQIMCDSIAN